MTAITDTRELLTLDRVDLNELFRQAVEIQNECRDFNVSNVTYRMLDMTETLVDCFISPMTLPWGVEVWQ